jgi:hypothetical protein
VTLVNLTNPDQVATLILTAAVCQYDPGTPPWIALHRAADEIREAINADPSHPQE